MAKFRVLLQRPATLEVVLEVDAPTREQAEQIAIRDAPALSNGSWCSIDEGELEVAMVTSC